jgi:hypothetical protein
VHFLERARFSTILAQALEPRAGDFDTEEAASASADLVPVLEVRRMKDDRSWPVADREASHRFLIRAIEEKAEVGELVGMPGQPPTARVLELREEESVLSAPADHLAIKMTRRKVST